MSYFNIQDAIYTTTAGNVGIGVTNPTNNLHVVGDINSTTSLKINNTTVLGATTLGSGVVNSSLTSLGTQAEALDMGDQMISTCKRITLDSDAITNKLYVTRTENASNGFFLQNNTNNNINFTNTENAAIQFKTNDTLRLTLAASGDINCNSNDITSVGTITATTLSGGVSASSLTVNGASSFTGTTTFERANSTAEGGEINLKMSDNSNTWNIDCFGSSTAQQDLRLFSSASGNKVKIQSDLEVTGSMTQGTTSLKGDIIPDADNAYDIGSASYKIRDMYVSDNSLWVGDNHKVSISGGKMKFRKRKTTSVPAAITAAGGTESAAISHASVVNLAAMKLKHWKAYMRTLSDQSGATIQDIFRDNTDDYDQEASVDNWLESGSKTYNTLGNVGIGTSDPSALLSLHYIPESSQGLKELLRLSWDDGNYDTLKGDGTKISFNTSNTNNFPGGEEGGNIGVMKANAVEANTECDFTLGLNNGTSVVERMRILSDGNVGIGATSPNYKLVVAGDINLTGDLRINGVAQSFGGSSTWSESNSEASYMGNVGIGIANPASLLHIVGANGDVNALIINNPNMGTTAGDGLRLGYNSNNNVFIWQSENAGMRFGTNNTEAMFLDASGKLGIGTSTPLNELVVHNDQNDFTTLEIRNNNTNNNTSGSQILFGGYRDVTQTTHSLALIRCLTQAGDITAVKAGALAFHIEDGNNSDGTAYGSLDEMMRLTSTGLGIGTNAPSGKLHISGSVTNTTDFSVASPLLRLTQTNGDTPWDWASIVLETGGYKHTIGMSLNTFQIKAKGDASGGNIEFIVGAGTTTAMNIDYTGKVGIGTNTPSTKLDVTGDIKAANVYSQKFNHSFNPSSVSTKYTQYIGTYSVNAILDIYLQDSGNSHGSGNFFRVSRDYNDNPVVQIDNQGIDGNVAKYSIHYRSIDAGTYELFFDTSAGTNSTINYTTYVKSNGTGGISNSLSASNDTNITECLVTFCTRENGNVGIGTNAPSYKFDVAGDINLTGSLRINGVAQSFGGGGGSSFTKLTETMTGQYGSVETTGTGANGWEGYSINGRYAFMSADNNGAGLYNDLDNKWISYYQRLSATTGNIQFYVGTATAKVTFLSSGLVGIGTTTPTTLLDINGSNSTTTPSLLIRNGNDNNTFNNGTQIAFGYNGTDDYQHFIHTRHNGSNSLNAIDFYTCNGTQNNTLTGGSIHTMSLVSGNVGIGITDPYGAAGSGNIEISGYYTRSAFNKGYLCGAQQTIGQTAAKTNPIYCIGGNFEPTTTALDNMYGIGFAQNTTFLPNDGTWGLYVTQNGQLGSFLAGSTGGNSFVMGNLGIGTNAPIHKLDVNGNARVGRLYIKRSNISEPYIDLNQGSSKGFGFYTNATERLSIVEGGNVGIGATSPNEKLQVVGDIRFGANSKLVLDQNSWQTCGNIELTSGSGTFGFHATGGGNTLGIYVDGNIRTDGIVYINGSQGIKTPTGGYGTIQCSGNGNGNWEGFSIDGRYVFMSDGGDNAGIYNDVDDKWIQLYNRGGNWHKFYVNGEEKMKLDIGGRFHILNTGDNGDYCFSITTDNNNGQMAWRWNGSGSDYNLDLYMDNNSGNNHKVGYIENSGSGTWRINDFTGQHRCIPQNNINSSMYGLIVYSTGKYMNIDNNISPTMIDSLPICDLCTIENDQRVFGVISDEADDNNDRKVGYGIFGTYQQKTNKNEKRVHINGVGEGGMWVCNKNGNIPNGSYISSSGVSGYGMKQDTNHLLNSTVAKITCDCNFNLNPIVKQKIKLIQNIQNLKRQKKINYESVHTEIKYDEEINQYREFEITKSYSKIETEDVPICDSNGEQLINDKGELMIHEIEVMEDYQVIETDIDFDDNGNVQYEDDLDDNGQQQMKYEYDTRFLNSDGSIILTEEEYQNKKENGENVYISCMIGCSYHCS